jgi:8-oxo-dGTP pyrophosphatase MutT (NUDIX family)
VRRLRDPLLRLAFRVGHRVLRVYWWVVRPKKRGVKCVLVRDGQILLVRHTYGDGSRWDVPGGGVKRREEPGEAARREMREELGIDVTDWTYLGELFARIDGRRDQLWCFTSEIGDHEIELDRAEIAEAGWFRRDRLPERTAKYVGRIASLSR